MRPYQRQISFLFLGIIFCLLFLPDQSRSALFPPDQDWRTIVTGRFRVHFPADAESHIPHIIAYADAAYDSLFDYFGNSPKIHLVVVTQKDFANGYYAPFPNRIYLYLTPPQTEDFCSQSRDWLENLITHELAHAFHLNRVGGWTKGVRRMFGEWVMPSSLVPLHITEGIATYAETRFTSGGRGTNPYFSMKLKSAILEDTFWKYDQMGYPSRDRLPGDRHYVSGYYWMEYLHATYRDDVFPRILDRQISRPHLGIGSATRYVTGKSTGRLYDDFVTLWRAKVLTDHHRRKDRQLLPPEKIDLKIGDNSVISRLIAVSNTSLVALYSDYDTASMLTEIDLSNRALKKIFQTHPTHRRSYDYHVAERKQVISELRIDPKYRAVYTSKMTLVDSTGRRQRLNSGDHSQHVRFSPDGKGVICTKNQGPFNNLWRIDIVSDVAEQLTHYEKSMLFDPLFAPDGRRIIFSRHSRGCQDFVIFDPTMQETRQLTEDCRAKFAPAISPDGSYLVFTADYDGAFNIYGMELSDSSRSIRRITDQTTGCYDPAFTLDGSYLYFTMYGSDGYDLCRLPFDFEKFPEYLKYGYKNPPLSESTPVTLPDKIPQHQPYHGIRYLTPTFWLPVPALSAASGWSPGVFTMAMDPLETQLWYGLCAYGIEDKRLLWNGLYLNRHRFPAWYLRTDAVNWGETYYTYRSSGTSSQEYRRRLETIRSGIDINIVTQTQPTRLSFGFDFGYRFARYRSLTKDADFYVPSADIGGVYGFAYGSRSSRTPRDIASVGQSLTLYHELDRDFFGSDYNQEETRISAVSNHRARAFWQADHHIMQISYAFRKKQSLLLFDDDVLIQPDRDNTPQVIRRTTRHHIGLSYLFPVKYVDRGWGNFPFFLHRVSGRLLSGYSTIDYRHARSDDEIFYAGAALTFHTTLFYGIQLDIRGGFYMNITDNQVQPIIQTGLQLPSAELDRRLRAVFHTFDNEFQDLLVN